MTKFRTALLGAVIAATLIASSSAGFAEQGTPEQRAACMGDAFRFCSSAIPNVSRIVACLRANTPKLSPACRTVLAKG